jgi:hypothetical protein
MAQMIGEKKQLQNVSSKIPNEKRRPSLSSQESLSVLSRVRELSANLTASDNANRTQRLTETNRLGSSQNLSLRRDTSQTSLSRGPSSMNVSAGHVAEMKRSFSTDLVARDNQQTVSSTPSPATSATQSTSMFARPTLSRYRSNENHKNDVAVDTATTQAYGTDISSPPILSKKQYPVKVVPYEELVKRSDPELDLAHLEVSLKYIIFLKL